MRIGVTAHIQFSFFSGGIGATSLAVAEVFKNLGHEVWLLNTNPGSEWWDDCKSMQTIWKPFIISAESVRKGEVPPFDYILEIEKTLFQGSTERARAAQKCVWVLRRSIVFHDIEASLYPFDNMPRNVDGLSAAWTFDITSTQDDLKYLECVARCPVFTVPFTWTPSILEIYRAETKLPEWLEVTRQTGATATTPWNVHICETNNSAASSLTLPLVTLRYAKQHGFPITKWKAHNADNILRSDFYKNNVKKHCDIEGLSGEYIGRQRLVDWIYDTKSCILSHMRFSPLRPYQLDAVWCGIPMVHNSVWLRDLVGTGYDTLYYPDNELVAASKCLDKLQADFTDTKGLFTQDARALTRKLILEKVTPYSVAVCNGWIAAVNKTTALSVKAAVAVPMIPSTPVAIPLAIPVAIPVAIPLAIPVAKPQEERVFRVVFTDMWDDFNPSYNMFTLMLTEAGRHLTPPVRIEGFAPQDLKEKPDLCMFGPFGNRWIQFDSSIPKVHYTGENSPMIGREDVKLNIGFQHADFKDQEYLRLPLWMLEIDWFGCDKERIANPKPLSIDACTKVDTTEGLHKKFCAFVVTNPCNPVRNAAFQWLSQYKRVDSAGRLYNNVGDVIFAGLGGGGGEIKKFEFLRDYKFCLAYENSSSQGYTTEKFLHAKAAGCVPIYWGDPKIERDFDSAGFIDARNFTRPDQLIEAVRKLDQSPELYSKAFSVPALDETRRDLVRRTLSECARRIFNIGFKSDDGLDAIPRFLGATSDEEAQKRSGTIVTKKIRVLEKPNGSAQPITRIVFATAATRNYLAALHQLITSITAQKQSGMNLSLEGHVWLGKDVEESVAKEINERFSWIQFHRFPDLVVEGFPDLFDPQHFAWKLWIYQYLVKLEKEQGAVCLYLDAGIFMCRWPIDWMNIANEEGICMIQDPYETNNRWCHKAFCDHLQVTDAEKAENQVLGGICSFVIGHRKPMRLFKEAWELAQKRHVIVGDKWTAIGPDGKPYGHRHDQSILSILSSRHGLARYPLETIYCDESLRRTFLTKKAFYVHRGSFTVHKQFEKGIDDCYVINLDRRTDRMEKLYKNSPTLERRIQRVSAFEGKKIHITPAIARLFRPHDFDWKKPVLGCALSHLSIWWQLANERDDIHSYLILEDDAKLAPNWQERWNAAVPHIPEGYDILYLGGILPPNRPGFEGAKERVNDHFSQVKENTFFGQSPPTRYFHWCAYAYVLSKEGARKVLQILAAKDGYWTSADHMLCNPVGAMNMYFLDPLVAGCYQDDDPKYQVAAFNDFSRVDQFDSDLWNNNERFNEAECIAMSRLNLPIDIPQALADARQAVKENLVGKQDSEDAKVQLKQSVSTLHPLWKQLESAVKTKELELARELACRLIENWDMSWLQKNDEEMSIFVTAMSCKTFSGLPAREILKELAKKWIVLSDAAPQGTTWSTEVRKCFESFLNYMPQNNPARSLQGRRILYLRDMNLEPEKLFEGKWLQELFGDRQTLRMSPTSIEDSLPTDEPILILMRPWWNYLVPIIQRWISSGTKFYLLHLSDEYEQDPIHFYGAPECLGIVRMYWRKDILEFGDKVLVIPLGYHWTKNAGIKNPLMDTPRLPFREYTWSFMGTNWQDRESQMKGLTVLQPHYLKWLKEWNDSEMLGCDEYLNILLNSKFVPVPGGNNQETYRFYEALECGCIPVYIRQPGDELLVERHYKPWLPIVDLPSWDHVAGLMFQLSSNHEVMEQYRNAILEGYRRWKEDLSQKVIKILNL